MKLTEQAIEAFANSLLECDGKSLKAHGVKGENRTPWEKTFKDQAAYESWLEKTDKVEVHGVTVVPDETNPANDLDEE